MQTLSQQILALNALLAGGKNIIVWRWLLKDEGSPKKRLVNERRFESGIIEHLLSWELQR